MLIGVLPALGQILYGLALSVLAYRSYAAQREILKGDNLHAALSIAIEQALLGTTLLATVALAVPSIAYGTSLLWWSVFCYPFLAAVVAGGYAHLREVLLRANPASANQIFAQYDNILQSIPKPISRFLYKLLSFTHSWLGTIYIGLQLSFFTVMAVGSSPLIGITGLTYHAVIRLKARRYLPDFISSMLEKVDYYVELLSGVFLRSTVLRIAAVFRIAYELFINIALPSLIRRLLIPQSDFSQFANLGTGPKVGNRIDNNIDPIQFEKLLDRLPAIERLPIDMRSRSGRIMDELAPILHDLKHKYNSIDDEEVQYGYLARMDRKVTQAFIDATNILNFSRELLQRIYLQRNKDYVFSASHIQHLPRLLPAVDLDFTLYKASLEGHYHIIVKSFKQDILFSPKFFVNAKHDGLGLRVASLRRRISNSRIIERELQDAMASSQRGAIPSNALIVLEVQAIIDQSLELVRLTDENDDPIVVKLIDAQSKRIEEAEGVSLELCMGAIYEKFLIALKAQNELDRDLLWQETQSQIKYWGQELLGDSNRADDEVLVAYFKMRIYAVLDEIEYGRNLAVSKKIDSIAQFQTMAKHVLKVAMDYICAENEIERERGYRILVNLYEAGDLCGTGIYDVVDEEFLVHVKPRLFADRHQDFSVYDHMMLFLQEQRQELFDHLMAALMNSETANALELICDLKDRHTQVAIMQILAPLKLVKSFTAESELAGQPQGFVADLTIKTFAYLLMRTMMSLKNGYSPEYIVSAMHRQFKNGNFAIMLQCNTWSEKFTNDAVKQKIGLILVNEQTEDFSSEEAANALCKLYTLMLYDLGIINCISSAQAAIEEIMPSAKTPIDRTSSAAMTFTWSAWRVVQSGVDKLKGSVDYVTREHSEQELLQTMAMEGPPLSLHLT